MSADMTPPPAAAAAAAAAFLMLTALVSVVAGGGSTNDDGEMALLSVHTAHFSLAIFANCSAVATNLRTRASSKTLALLSMFNRASDNHHEDFDPCVAASLVSPGVVRVVAAHDYGTVDIGVKLTHGGGKTGGSGATENAALMLQPRSAGFVTFTVLKTSDWHGDPLQKHLTFTPLCPTDLCPTGSYPSGSDPSAAGETVDSGKFQGFYGWGGEGPAGALGESSGWFTISSNWQYWTYMLFVQPGWKLVYTIAPTTGLPALLSDISQVRFIC